MLRLLVAAIAGAATLFATAMLVPRFDEPMLVQIVGAISGFVLIPALVLKLWRLPTAIEQAKAARTLEVWRFDVVAAVPVQELEDEGPQYFLETSDGGTLFVCGQPLYEAVESGAFPSAQLMLTVDSRQQEILAVESSGARIPVHTALPAFTEEEIYRGRVPVRLTRYSEPPAVVVASLGRST